MAFEGLTAAAICSFARLLTGVRAIWRGGPPEARQRIYFANHRSHADFVLVWASLPRNLRSITRPVAGSDYWLKGPLRQYLAQRVFRSVLVDRGQGLSSLQMLQGALAAGDSLVLFPEGTRNQEDGLQPFKGGIFHLAKNFPEVELVPVWIENIGRAMPKGALVPVPLLCTLTFGEAFTREEGETKEFFLKRCRQALLELAPGGEKDTV